MGDAWRVACRRVRASGPVGIALLLMGAAGCGAPLEGAGLRQILPLEELRARAEAGDAESLYEMGWRYRWGQRGVETDPEMAYHWYHRSAERGHGGAMWILGLMYSVGEGMDEPNTELALHWMERAAARGSNEARVWLDPGYMVGDRWPPASRRVSPGSASAASAASAPSASTAESADPWSWVVPFLAFFPWVWVGVHAWLADRARIRQTGSSADGAGCVGGTIGLIIYIFVMYIVTLTVAAVVYLFYSAIAG